MAQTTRTPGRVRAGRANQKLALAAKKAQAEAAARPPALATTKVQDRLVAAALSGENKIIGFGGGMRGTKTFGGLILLILLCRMYPRSRWAITRESLTTLKRNTLPSFAKLRELSNGFVGEFNKSDWVSTCSNGSQLVAFAESLHEDPHLDRFNGLEVNGFLADESNELSVDTFEKMKQRAGAWIVPGLEQDAQPPALIICTFNPCDNWPRDVFYEPFQSGTLPSGYAYIPATYKDNPYVTPQLWAMWALMPPDQRERFVEGVWSRVVAPNQLIEFSWITDATHTVPDGGISREAIDVARYGNDKTVFARFHGNTLAELEMIEQMDTSTIAKRAAARIEERGTSVSEYRVDAVGVGAGVVDALRSAGKKVIEFVAGASPVDRKLEEAPKSDRGRAPESMFRFANLRSQAWWEFREKLRLGLLRIGDPAGTDPPVSVTHPELVQDLLSARYDYIRDKVIAVNSKDEMKEILGRSPDYGDAVVMAAFDLPKVFVPRVFRPGDFKKLRR